jgi:PAS domain S-box-containing protein
VKRRSQVSSDSKDDSLSNFDYNQIFSLCPDMIMVANQGGIICERNPACERVLGYSAKEMIGLSWESFVHPDDIQRTREQVALQLKRKSVVNFVNRFRAKSGEYKTLQWQGAMAGSGLLLGVARDITEQVNRSDLLASLALHERKSLLASLHDGVSQELFGLRMLSSQLRKALQGVDTDLTERAELIEGVTDHLFNAIRSMMEGLSPCGELSEDFASCLLNFRDRIENIYGVRCVMQLQTADLAVQPEVGFQLWLIVQEAVMNAVKHAQASMITVEVQKESDDTLTVRITDNGKGFHESECDTGFGITIMRERAALIGATLEMGEGEQGGVAVICRWHGNDN